jgi:Mrp family chromosome partitioning ATPase
MLDALKQIESEPAEKSIAEPSGKPADDELLPPEPIEAEPRAVIHGQDVHAMPEAELNFPDDLLADTAALLDEYEKGELQSPPQEEPQPHDSRHMDLAANILAQIPARGPVTLFFAAPASTGVFAPSLVPLFSALAKQAGGRTLVVECDFRRAVLAARFGVEPKAGLGDVLASRAEWRSAVCRTEQESLDVICARAAGSADAAVRSSVPSLASWPSVDAALAEMREEYRLVLLENVSATGDQMSQLAALCHGAYLLIRAGQTPRHTARGSVAKLKSDGGQLLGCILLDA